MMKLRKEKVLVSLIVITLITLVFGSIYSLATTPLITNSSSTDSNTTGAVNSSTNNTTNVNASNSSSTAIVGSTVNSSSNTNSNTNTNTNSNTNKNVSNSSSNTNSSSLPYAGTNSSIVLIIVVLAISALYAYKKISDCNV